MSPTETAVYYDPYDGMRLAPTSTVRGWEAMPIVLP
jgi:hypothetical protein